jgi:nucleoside-diphosphate-sugar epimerase
MIFVTGATGLVGSHLIKQLAAAKKTVRAIYRNSPPVWANQLANEVQWVQADILDVVALEEAMQGVTQVYHCAAVVSFQPNSKHQMHQTNVQGTANLVNACLNAGVKKLVYVSSVAALGRIREDKPIDETMNWTPETSNSEYGKTKYLAEMEVWRGIGEGLDAVMVNPTIILGAGNWDTGSSGIFKSAYNEFPWFTEGTTGFVDVQDVVNAMTMLMETKISAQRFILSADTWTYQKMFTAIANCFGKQPPHKKVTPLLAALVWRWEAIKGKFTGKAPLLTKETATTAQAKVSFNNSKLLQHLPQFTYTPLQTSIQRICAELKQIHNL